MMYAFPKFFTLSLLTLILFVLAHPVQVKAGFHDQEQLECAGCHGLNAKDPSSTCLRCHSVSFRVLSMSGDAYTPGGDFFWLKKNYLASGYLSFGENHGHNVVAEEFGLTPDGFQTSAPNDGSTLYRAEWLSCTSCHDPHQRTHARKGFRLLGDVDYKGGGKAKDFTFTNAAPLAKAARQGANDWLAENDQNHTVYGSGMSEWCANCHSGFPTKPGLSHPAGNSVDLGPRAKSYNRYKSGVDKSGTKENSYDFLVPFERGTVDLDGLGNMMETGPDEGSNVMCLTCHRAHASAFKAIGRWDFAVERLNESPVLSSAERIHAYYGHEIVRRYGEGQKTLCNKCHEHD